MSGGLISQSFSTVSVNMFQVLRVLLDEGNDVRAAARLRDIHYAAVSKKKEENDHFASIRKHIDRQRKINELRRLEGTLLEGVQQPFRSTVLSQRRKMMRDVKIKNAPP